MLLSKDQVGFLFDCTTKKKILRCYPLVVIDIGKSHRRDVHACGAIVVPQYEIIHSVHKVG
eukprot:SAG31_NODE_5743_length_2349_cov_1.514667_1_plen_60_part_10